MNTEDFFEYDFASSLFPLKTNLLMITKHASGLREYIYGRVLSKDAQYDGDCFLPQQRVHAAKPRHHLRRTVCLDPVASYFFYDVIFKNRKCFRKPVSEDRKCFGYRFFDAKPISIHEAYKDFKEAIDSASKEYAHSMQFDIASYFNSLYHHDVAHWFAALPNTKEDDISAISRFFREINAGRSIDFLPHGIYPSKMVGNEFLKFIDLTKEIKSAKLYRFMDDICLFDNDETTLIQDFIRIQELLGAKGLSINPTKTLRNSLILAVSEAASEIAQELKCIVEIDWDLIAEAQASGMEGPIEIPTTLLSDEQVQELLKLLVDPRAEESDIEQILSILGNHSDSIIDTVATLITRFPSVIKQIYNICKDIGDKESLASSLLRLVRDPAPLSEYQLFWLATIAEDHLKTATVYCDLILSIYARSGGCKIARAKILEIPDQWYGLKEIRDEHLKTGSSDWLSWSSAMGTRTLKAAERNYVLDYFSKGSPLNYLISSCVQSL